MKNKTFEILIGAVVLGIAFFFFVYSYKNSGSEHSARVSYNASFDRVDGIVVGSDVRMSGVKIGIIKKLTVNIDTYMAEVSFAINQDIKLPSDSSAEIVSDGLLGGKYLALVPGGGEVFIKAGDSILHTQSSVNLEAMIGQLMFSKKSDKK